MESGLLSDRDVPVIIHPFSAFPKEDNPLLHPSTPSTTHTIDSSSSIPPSSSSSTSYQREYAAKAFAGSYHSIVIDQAGAVWTWGARGSPCLGHGDIVSLQGSWANKINAVFAASTTQTKVMVPYELRAWCDQWSRPRKLSPLTHGDHRVVQVSAGDLHTAFLTSNGRLYLCGRYTYTVAIIAPFLTPHYRYAYLITPIALSRPLTPYEYLITLYYTLSLPITPYHFLLHTITLLHAP